MSRGIGAGCWDGGGGRRMVGGRGWLRRVRWGIGRSGVRRRNSRRRRKRRISERGWSGRGWLGSERRRVSLVGRWTIVCEWTNDPRGLEDVELFGGLWRRRRRGRGRRGGGGKRCEVELLEGEGVDGRIDIGSMGGWWWRRRWWWLCGRGRCALDDVWRAIERILLSEGAL